MTVPERMLSALSLGPRDDDELAILIGVARQYINQAARSLAARGRIVREQGPSGKIVQPPPGPLFRGTRSCLDRGW